jgi:menaquinone-dependent protoporphyrinogen oxidase
MTTDHPAGAEPAGVLVAYASAHGSTREIAERIAARLRSRGVSAEAACVDSVASLDGYRAAVVGSAVHDRGWLPGAARFLERNTDGLLQRPVWLFAVGMPAALARPLRRPLAAVEARQLFRRFAGLHPRGTRLFSGVVDPGQFSQRVSRIALRAMGGRYGDFRDWPAIEAWADEIAAALTVPLGSTPGR